MQTLYKLASKRSRKLVPLTPSGSLFSKIQAKKCRRALYISTTTHDRWKPAWVILPRLQTEPHGVFFYNITCHPLKQWSLIEATRGEPGSKTKCRWDHCLDRWGLVCRRGRITQAGFQRSCVVVWMYKALLKTNCRLASVGPDCLANDMRWNETRTYWLGLGFGFVANWTF